MISRLQSKVPIESNPETGRISTNSGRAQKKSPEGFLVPPRSDFLGEAPGSGVDAHPPIIHRVRYPTRQLPDVASKQHQRSKFEGILLG